LVGHQRATVGVSLAALLTASGAFGATGPATVDDEGVSVVIVQTGAAPAASGQVNGVILDIEVTDDEVAALHGYRSLKSVVDVDCRGERDLVREARAFPLPRLTGASQVRTTSGQWVRPTPEAYMSRVIKTICSRVGLRPVGEGAAVTAAASPPAARRSSTLAQTVATPPRLQPALALPAGPQAAPKAPLKSVGPASSTEASVAAARLRVQIASLASPSAAQAVLDAVKYEIQPPLAGEIEAAEVRGRKTYRSIVDNFSSEAAANAFCVRMKQAMNTGCIVWKGPSR
jgi:hypothetical protein